MTPAFFPGLIREEADQYKSMVEPQPKPPGIKSRSGSIVCIWCDIFTKVTKQCNVNDKNDKTSMLGEG